MDSVEPEITESPDSWRVRIRSRQHTASHTDNVSQRKSSSGASKGEAYWVAIFCKKFLSTFDDAFKKSTREDHVKSISLPAVMQSLGEYRYWERR